MALNNAAFNFVGGFLFLFPTLFTLKKSEV